MPTKVRLVKAMVIPVVLYGCECWTIKKAEHQRTDAFALWCCRRLLRVLWTARIVNQSIRNEFNPEYSLEGLMLKLKLQYLTTWCKELTHLKRPWCLEGLKAGGEGDSRGWDGWVASPTQWTWVWVNSACCWCIGQPCLLQSMGTKELDMTKYWTELIIYISKPFSNYIDCHSCGYHGAVLPCKCLLAMCEDIFDHHSLGGATCIWWLDCC